MTDTKPCTCYGHPELTVCTMCGENWGTQGGDCACIRTARATLAGYPEFARSLGASIDAIKEASQ